VPIESAVHRFQMHLEGHIRQAAKRYLQAAFKIPVLKMWAKILNLEYIIYGMSTLELRRRLIEKIQLTHDDRILEEVFRILELETAEDIGIFKLNDEQKGAIREGRMQVENGQFLTEEEANKEIDEWLND
jgi:hypothetical protein